MKFPKLAFVVTIVAAALYSGCSKKAELPQKSVALGDVELKYSTPVRKDLGDGFVCVLTAETMDAANIELNAILEKDGKKISSTRALPVRINQSLPISFGSIRVELTPHIKE